MSILLHLDVVLSLHNVTLTVGFCVYMYSVHSCTFRHGVSPDSLTLMVDFCAFISTVSILVQLDMVLHHIK